MAKLQRTSDADLERVELTDGDWVEVKRKLGKDDERERQRRMLRGVGLKGGKLDAADASVAFEAVFCTFEVALKAWSLTDGDTGEVAPITPAAIRAMDDEDVKILALALNDLYEPPLTGAEAKN